MVMNFKTQGCILLTHVFIEPGQEQKLDQCNFVVEHYRKNNPNDYIIVTGHGLKPDKLEKYCDYVDWSDELIRSDIGYGHPVLVNRGIDHAKSEGFSHLLKGRLDCINLMPNIFEWCMSELGNKKYLTTQATAIDNFVLCDLFNFGSVDVMKKCWDIEDWYPNLDGLVPHAKNFFNLCKEDTWTEALKNNCVIKDILTLKWIDFRAANNWAVLSNRKQEMFDNNLEGYKNYLWGYPGFAWDDNGDLTNLISDRGIWATERNHQS